MTHLFRTITLVTALALLLFVGLHAVVPHDHPHAEGYHWSELPPMAHAENKIFLMVFALLLVFLVTGFAFPTLSADSAQLSFVRLRIADAHRSHIFRYHEALRRGRIHSKAY